MTRPYGPGNPDPARVAAYRTHIRAKIRENGWIVQGVFGVNSGELAFLYTVGLTAAGLPELVIHDVPNEYMPHATAVINHLAKLSLSEDLAPERRYPSGLNVFTTADIRPVDHNPARPLSMAASLYGPDKVTIVEVTVNGAPWT